MAICALKSIAAKTIRCGQCSGRTPTDQRRIIKIARTTWSYEASSRATLGFFDEDLSVLKIKGANVDRGLLKQAARAVCGGLWKEGGAHLAAIIPTENGGVSWAKMDGDLLAQEMRLMALFQNHSLGTCSVILSNEERKKKCLVLA